MASRNRERENTAIMRIFINDRLLSGLTVLLLHLLVSMHVATAQDKCQGICSADGEQLLNPADEFQVDNRKATCSVFDDLNKGLDDIGTACDDDSQAVQDAGCKCGIPIECPGICAEGDQMLNAATDVSIGNTMATCGFYDNKNKEIIDEEVCAANAQAAQDAGCKCGIPIECPGICAEGDQMLNAATDVSIGNTMATCGFYDNKNKEIIDEEVCTANAQAAQDAGCKCGTPIECPGICAEGETLNDPGLEFEICGTTATCGYFDSQNQNEIDEEVCSQNAINARVAGCNCTGEYPDDTEIDCTTSGATSFGAFFDVVRSMLIGTMAVLFTAAI
mmetsp:Transcript_23914/g.49379  ORF Transcript_23914/g.49379 Transcript_23914/m.49379 type:complete len:334 (-) Transcript_23914:319-1320(-)